MIKRNFFIKFNILIFTLIFLIAPIISAQAYTPLFEVHAKSALLIGLDEKDIIYQKNKDDKVYPASTVKIMTVAILLEHAADAVNDKITVSSEAVKSFSGSYNAFGIKEGDVYSPKDLTALILLGSSNEAAHIAADHLGGKDAFIKLMNEKAAALQMNATNYTNVTGFHDTFQVTTVSDIYKLVRHAISIDALTEVVKTRMYEIEPKGDATKTVSVLNGNWLLDGATPYFYKYATGMNCGYTEEAGRCLVATAEKEGEMYICILMNSPDASAANDNVRYEFTDAQKLFDWAFSDFSYKKVVEKTKAADCEAKIKYGKSVDYVMLYPSKDLSALVPSVTDGSTVEYEYTLDKDAFEAPIKAGDVMGKMTVKYAGNQLGEVTLVAGNDVERSLPLYLLGQLLRLLQTTWFWIVAVILILLIALRITMVAIAKKRRRERKEKNEMLGE